MADFAQILIRAKDQTKGAFDSASNNVRGLETAASKLNGALGALGLGVTAAGLVAIAKRGIDAADALNDLSARTGVSVKTLAGWNLAADQSGTSLEALGKGVQKLALSIGEAEGGAKKQAAALERLGVTARDPQQAFEQLADAVAQSNDPLRTNADLQDVLGKSYAELLPLLQQGAHGLRESASASATFAEAMERLAPDADKFNDQLALLKMNAAGAAASILAELVPSLNEYLAVGREVIKNGTLLDKVRFFGLGNASDEIVNRVRINLAASAGWMDKLRNSAARANAESNPVKASNAPAKLKPPKAAPGLIDALGTGSFKTYSKEVAAAIKEQQDAINALNSEIARTVQLYDALGSGSYLTGDTATADFIREQQDAINDLNGEIAASMQANAEQIRETRSAAEEFGVTFTSALEDAIVTGASFSDMLKGLEADIARMLVRKTVTEPLMSVDWGALLGGIIGSANGNAFSGVPGLSAYSGSVVDRPTLFPFAAGAGLMGEAGPEAILPLKRGADGKLGIEGGSSGGVQVNVINNAAGTQATATEREDNGVRIVDVMVEQVEGAMSRRLGRGEGLAPVMERRYGLNPGAGAL